MHTCNGCGAWVTVSPTWQPFGKFAGWDESEGPYCAGCDWDLFLKDDSWDGLGLTVAMLNDCESDEEFDQLLSGLEVI